MRNFSRDRIPAALLGLRGFGYPVNYYPGLVRRGMRWLATGCLFGLGALMATLWAAAHILARWIHFGLAAIMDPGGLLLLVGGTLLLLIALVFFIVIFLPDKHFMTYTGGLACLRGKSILAWHWEDFTSLWIDRMDRWNLGQGTRARMQLKLGLPNGKAVKIGPAVQGIHGLRDELRTRLYPRWQADAARALQRGDDIRFGPLTVNHERGIASNGLAFPWDNLEHITIQKGQLQIVSREHKDKAVVTLNTREIPNLEIFAGLVKPYLIIKTPEATDLII